MEEKEKQILKFAQLAIKEMRSDGDFTLEDKSEMQKILIELGTSRVQILAKASDLLLRA